MLAGLCYLLGPSCFQATPLVVALLRLALEGIALGVLVVELVVQPVSNALKLALQ